MKTAFKHLKNENPRGTIFYIHGYNTTMEGRKCAHTFKFCEKNNIDYFGFDLLGKNKLNLF